MLPTRIPDYLPDLKHCYNPKNTLTLHRENQKIGESHEK